MICNYGCGKEGKFQFKNGNWCCSKNWQSCEAMISINKESHIGKIGNPCSIETKLKISKANKGKIRSKETKINIGKSSKGRIPWNKGKTGIYSKETLWEIGKANRGKKFSKERRKNIAKTSTGRPSWNKGKKLTNEEKIKFQLSISKIKKKYPLFFKIEEMRYEPGKEDEKIIQVHCKNHNCKNSKEQGGWFSPLNISISERIRQLENIDGTGGSYLYCSDKCKDECPLYRKSVIQLIKEDLIRAGHISDSWYVSSEYQTWRRHILELDDNKCVYCEKEATVAHHILPQKSHPELSLDPTNGLSVCQECHYKYGHRNPGCTTGKLSTLVCDRIIKIKRKEK